MDTQNSPSAETRKRQLHDGRPFWAATPDISVPALARPGARSYAVVIVGAGISGALAAEALSRRFKRVLILDRRAPVRGSTLASTAMIQHEIDTPLSRLAGMIGEAAAVRAWHRSAAAVTRLAELSKRLKLDCDMVPKKTLYLAGDDMGARGMEAEARLRLVHGLTADWLNAPALRARFGLERTGGIVSTASASANPAQLAAGLLGVAQARGAEVVSPAEVTDFVEVGDHVALGTAEGRVILAEHAVFTTGYEFLPEMQSRAHRICSTWAVASETGIPRPDWLDEFLVWEASDPYLYFRSAAGGRIIAGGEDEDGPSAHSDKAKLTSKPKRIAAKLKSLTGIDLGRVAYSWAAPFGITTTGLPIIDLVPGCARTHAVMGFGGNGITFSSIAAEHLSARIAGKVDPDAELFAFPEG